LDVVFEDAIGLNAGEREIHVHAGRRQSQRLDLLHGLDAVHGVVNQLCRLKMHPVPGLLVDERPKLAA
jgi:hypothetical protein